MLGNERHQFIISQHHAVKIHIAQVVPGMIGTVECSLPILPNDHLDIKLITVIGMLLKRSSGRQKPFPNRDNLYSFVLRNIKFFYAVGYQYSLWYPVGLHGFL